MAAAQKKRQQDLHPTHASPVYALTQVSGNTLPEDEAIVPKRPPSDLLRDSQGVANLAYVRAAWAYSQACGEETFPEGLHA